MVILISTRWLFAHTIFHFHAGGLTDVLYPKLSKSEQVLFRWAYRFPDATIRMSELTPSNIELLAARQDFIVPYGVTEPLCTRGASPVDNNRAVIHRLLFVGAVRESKGFLVLLHACRLLQEWGIEFELDVMGAFQSQSFAMQTMTFLEKAHLSARVHFLGVLEGQAKAEAFSRATIFCFPTFYESEAFSVVLVEALSYGLPVVTTEWRGIPQIIPNGQCGFVVPIHDPVSVAEKIRCLLADRDLHARMSAACRQRYLEHYTIAQYHRNLERVFHAVCRS
jgi:glycosyltransferase involved in cell wall biosynthesis